ncbi:hypothetical protein L228DRAFT_268500 [Xylona heveae TC161]|uniref:Zn(2)-C6 fungal-type domain-containing protein n=1 Tax=Xylona heveae (strain CBS 132557 / TC161) TaxID=1328760 RepID=A0A165GBR1_XYLHT|nr:hypothetical protein L228DRAFT_268500 [Xylona heveae TC161]KZF21996.1 hypothetical protein L228DRAFT_268500 [Xylona heveae TC161]
MLRTNYRERSRSPDAERRALQACASCRKQKRKCDKGLPGCGLCHRLGRVCDYSDSPPAPTGDDFQFLLQKIQDLENRLSDSTRDTTPHPVPQLPYTPPSLAVSDRASTGDSTRSSGEGRKAFTHAPLFFLDASVFSYRDCGIPKPLVTANAEILDLLGGSAETQAVAATYFATVHKWFPFVSKIRFHCRLSEPLSATEMDHALLCLCMKLIVQIPDSSDGPDHVLYETAKRLCHSMESTCLPSLQFLQALLLLALYEIGHAIYPAAYLSVGHCARLGQAMGLHRKDAARMLPKPKAWTEMEERRRVWWAAIILDRYVSIGNHGPPLATEDPNKDDYLPVDDISFDLGEMSANETLYVSSSTSIRASPFARTCQAAHLMGRVVRHMNDRNMEPSFRYAEANQLERTLRAFSSLLLVEQDPTSFAPLGICYSTLLTLCDTYSCAEMGDPEGTAGKLHMQEIAISGLRATSQGVLGLSQCLKACIRANGSMSVTPFLADCLYQGAANYAWYAGESGSTEYTEPRNQIREALVMLDKRWKLGGEYVKILYNFWEQ